MDLGEFAPGKDISIIDSGVKSGLALRELQLDARWTVCPADPCKEGASLTVAHARHGE